MFKKIYQKIGIAPGLVEVFFPRLIKLALPIALQQSLMTLVNLVDNLMIGQISEQALGSIAVTGQVYFLLMLFLFGVSSGSMAIMGQSFGKHDLREILRSFGAGLMTLLPGLILFLIASFFFTDELLGLFSEDSVVISVGGEYQRLVSLSYPATALSVLISFTLRSTREVKLPMIASSISLIINVIGNAILINLVVDGEQLGVLGAGIATFAARWIEFVLIIVFTLRKRKWLFSGPKRWFNFTKGFLHRYYKTTIPVIFNEILWSIGISMYLIVYGRISTPALAAYNILEIVIRISLIIFISMGNAGAILIGNTLGSNKLNEAQKISIMLVSVTPIIGVFLGLVVFALSPLIPQIYNISDEAKEITQKLLLSLLWVFPLKVLNLVLIVAIFRSGGDTLFSVLMDAGTLWVVGVPLAFLLGLELRIDPGFVFGIASVEELIKGIMGLFRLKSRKWIHKLHEEVPETIRIE